MPLGDRSRARRRSGACGSAACSCILLDTDLEENAPWDRELSARLYGGDRETRVQQEIILGIGGVRALRALGIDAGGLAPERRARRRSSSCSASASYIDDGHVVRRGARGSAAHDGLHDAHAGAGRPRRVPVPPGREAPGRRLGHARRAPRSRFLALGDYDNGGGPQFNMTALALRIGGRRSTPSASCTARSRATMWAPIWPERAGRRSGRCARSPTACTCRPGCRPRWRSCSSDYLGADWRERHDDPAFWDARARRSRTRSCGRARSALRQLPVRVHPRARARSAGREEQRQRGARRRGRHAARSQRADDRLRAPVHRLQAAGADLPRPRAAARAS